jgi:hypothetical protein
MLFSDGIRSVFRPTESRLKAIAFNAFSVGFWSAFGMFLFSVGIQSGFGSRLNALMTFGRHSVRFQIEPKPDRIFRE